MSAQTDHACMQLTRNHVTMRVGGYRTFHQSGRLCTSMHACTHAVRMSRVCARLYACMQHHMHVCMCDVSSSSVRIHKMDVVVSNGTTPTRSTHMHVHASKLSHPSCMRV